MNQTPREPILQSLPAAWGEMSRLLWWRGLGEPPDREFPLDKGQQLPSLPPFLLYG